jgi:aspartate-semialdehyde dehydrogenase
MWSYFGASKNQDITEIQMQEETTGKKKRKDMDELKRLDYVLTESVIEKANQYIASVTSHSCYWTSKDVALFILKQIKLYSGTTR